MKIIYRDFGNGKLVKMTECKWCGREQEVERMTYSDVYHGYVCKEHLLQKAYEQGTLDLGGE